MRVQIPFTLVSGDGQNFAHTNVWLLAARSALATSACPSIMPSNSVQSIKEVLFKTCCSELKDWTLVSEYVRHVEEAGHIQEQGGEDQWHR